MKVPLFWCATSCIKFSNRPKVYGDINPIVCSRASGSPVTRLVLGRYRVAITGPEGDSV